MLPELLQHPIRLALTAALATGLVLLWILTTPLFNLADFLLATDRKLVRRHLEPRASVWSNPDSNLSTPSPRSVPKSDRFRQPLPQGF
jgi:hypothetical protein